MVSVKLPDGSVREFDGPLTVQAVAKSIGSRLAKDALWGEVNGQPVPLDHVIDGEQVELKIITGTHPAALATLQTFLRPCDGPGGDAAEAQCPAGVWSDH